MKNKNLVVNPGEIEVVEGKVVITSEELASAIRNEGIDLTSEEEDAAIDIVIKGFHCS